MKHEFSAGGVVFKVTTPISERDNDSGPDFAKGYDRQANQNDILILVAQHSQHHGWVFPKGFIGDKIEGETKEDTALREVEEETGVIGKILEPLTPITYWYVMDQEKHQKTVYYYIMEFVGGDITKHDWEMEHVEWLPVEKVAERLTYDSDKTVWQEAREKIEKILNPES